MILTNKLLKSAYKNNHEKRNGKNILGHIEHGKNRLEKGHSRDAKGKTLDDCCHCVAPF